MQSVVQHESFRRVVLLLGCLIPACVGLAALCLQVGAVGTPPPPIPSLTCQANNWVDDLLIHDGVIYFSGIFTSVRPPGAAPGSGEVMRTGLAACNATTGAILSWGPLLTHTIPANLVVETLALAPTEDRLYVGGRFTHLDGVAVKPLVAFTLTTLAATGWAPAWSTGNSSRVRDIAVSADGAIIYAGVNTGIKAWQTTNGASLPAFAPQIMSGTVQNTQVTALALSPDQQTIYFGGPM